MPGPKSGGLRKRSGEERRPDGRAVFRKRPVDARLAVLVRGCEEDQRRVVDVRSEDWGFRDDWAYWLYWDDWYYFITL